MSPPNCTLCCSKCRGNASAGSSRVRKDTNPYEVYCNFLPAGTVTIPLQSGEVTCSHTHAADGWHYLPSAVALEPTLVPNDAPLLRLRQLEFLVKHRFIAATCKLDHISNVLYVRVYLIPWDLPGAHGELRVRNEVSVVVPARRHLRSLLAEIIQDDDAWDALPPQDVVPEAEATTLKQRHFLTDDTDNRTMAEIYNDLRSPKPPAKFRIDKIADMRSVLYTYQKETVATMLAWELEPSSAADPLYIPITGIDGAVFYLQPETFEIQQECPRVVQTRGGILCEELGTGKTIMILGLILATRNQLSSPAESILDPRPVLTPLSLRHFPTGEEAQARARLLQGRGSSARLHTHANRAEPNTIPSLVEHLLHYCAVRPDAVQLWQHQEQLEQRDLWKPIIRNSPFYHHYEVAIPGLSRSKRKESNRGITTDPASHTYKIVLMTYHSFSLEAAANKDARSGLHLQCERRRLKGVAAPAGALEAPRDRRGPRLREQELESDNVVAGAQRRAEVDCDRHTDALVMRWYKPCLIRILNNYPFVANLLGLHHGQGSELQYPEDPDEPNTESTDEELSARRWTLDDRQDLNKLSTMMVHFLGVPQFATDPKLFERLVISPLMARSGPKTGAIQVLTQVMETMMIRHRVEDIENDVLLPLLNRETVLLDLDPYALMSYNAMQAMIAVNAVDSERKDQDYLFHPANAAPLNQLVDNMSQVMFWHVDDQSSFNVDEIAGRAKVFMANLAERGTSEADRFLMQQALKHVGLAANNIVWRQMQRNAFVYHRIQGIPDPAVYRAWTTFASSAADNLAGHDMMLHSDRALRFKQFVLRHPLYSVDRLVLGGKDVQEEERQRLALQRMEDARKKKRKRKSEGSAHRKEVETVKHVVATPEKREELRKEYLASWEKLQKHYEQDDEHAHSQSGSAPARPKTTSSWLLASSPMASVRVGKSTSTKLDYIINEIRQHSADEKFLIFSRSPLTLAYVSEGLELMGMKYLQFTTKVPREQRQHNIVTFETSELYRVFLMELQHGARGLNLIAASRVIFCEPVWQADVESQAIKRVHRIGQKRPVTVKTLAIRSTHEEVMVSRRDALLQSGAGAVKQPKLTEDTRIRDFIANPTFLSETSNPRLEIDFPLFDIQPPEPEVAREASRPLNGVQPTGTDDPRARDIVVVNSTNQRPGAEREASGSQEEPPRKKVRLVRF
ncbi:hypothetical protein EVJ58_g2267 [Rhodofomes roseus]|uniref:Helicase C-terminal domain-containing protein n=1 Tax=Rhodofomes roseus TaxID=34475 RepID=A0A4Y9YT64_9APHY|nr:hypothetical protein EVJ58_g2267 [Rhodofomes roseus]